MSFELIVVYFGRGRFWLSIVLSVCEEVAPRQNLLLELWVGLFSMFGRGRFWLSVVLSVWEELVPRQNLLPQL